MSKFIFSLPYRPKSFLLQNKKIISSLWLEEGHTLNTIHDWIKAELEINNVKPLSLRTLTRFTATLKNTYPTPSKSSPTPQNKIFDKSPNLNKERPEADLI